MSSSSINYKWPDHFPEYVPPSEAEPANGKVFRLVTNIPPTPQDFLSTREESGSDHYTDIHEIRSYGLSFFATISAIKHKRNKFRNALGHKAIATGELVPNLGVMQQTYSKHHWTVWLQEGTTPWGHINEEVKE